MNEARKNITLFVELESDMILLEALATEINIFAEAMLTDTDPEQSAFATTNYNQAVSSYLQHKDYILPRLEEYVRVCIDNSFPVDINYYRVLKLLREQKSQGV